MITLKEIARVCNVSQAVVSKALRDGEGVSPKTRQRVLRVANEFNYRPNALVRSLHSGRSMTIALACNTIDDPYAGAVMKGIVEHLSENQYEILMFSWDVGVRSGVHMLQAMGERRVDGLLMFPPAEIPSAEYMEELRAFHRPIVLIDQSWPQSEFDLVSSDDFAGGMAVAEHFIALGHRRIALIGNRSVSTGQRRFDGFMAAVVRHGIPIPDEWILGTSTGFEGDYEVGRRLLFQGHRPTAIACFNDMVALAVLAAARDLGIAVPQELSVAGFADLPMALQIRPTLTTVRQDMAAMGVRAAQRLLERINKTQQDPPLRVPETIVLPTSLIARESTGPCSDGRVNILPKA